MRRFYIIDRRMALNFDWLLLGVVLLLSVIGIATIYSATRPLGSEGVRPGFHIKQAYWVIAGLIAFATVASVHYRWYHRFAYLFYWIGISILLAVFAVGRTGMGAQRWISVGPLSFQPSELAKILLVIALARYLSDQEGAFGLRTLLKTFFMFLLIPLLLLLKQPDLGTGMMFLFVFSGMVLAAGIRPRVTAAVIIIALISIPFVSDIFLQHLRPYQRNRITAFLDPGADPTGIGYQIIQSKITVGSGGVLGKGYLEGTQAPLRFLPERHTDFIFSIFAEEWGFVGCALLLGIYLVWILRMLETAQRAKDRFGFFLVAGLTMMTFFYLFVNAAMTLGMLPVVGVPMPLLSYGGTALVSNFVVVGLVTNVRMRRYELFS